MSSKTFIVPSISCDHCTHTIETELADVAGVQSVKADVDSKQVSVTWQEPATWDAIVATLQEINFPPANEVALQ